MISFSDDKDTKIQKVRLQIINQLKKKYVLFHDDYEKLFNCKITPIDDVFSHTEYYNTVISSFRKDIVMSLIKTSGDEFTFSEIGKLFKHKQQTDTLFADKAYKRYQTVPISQIPSNAKDKNGKTVLNQLLKENDIVQASLKDYKPLFSKIPKITIDNKNLIDVTKTRDMIISIILKENPRMRIYREDYDDIFQAFTLWDNKRIIKLESKISIRNSMITNTITQFIKDCPELTYEAIGDIFNRTRQQIRDIARDNGIYRYDNGVGRHNDVIEGEKRSKRKMKTDKDLDFDFDNLPER